MIEIKVNIYDDEKRVACNFQLEIPLTPIPIPVKCISPNQPCGSCESFYTIYSLHGKSKRMLYFSVNTRFM